MSVSCLFASGKGGAGKSAVVANLAAVLSRAGYRTAVLDTDIGLRSLDALLGMEDRVVYDLIDVAEGNCALSDALLESPEYPGLDLLPAAQFARAKDLNPKRLKKITDLLKADHEFVLTDCPAGLGRGLRNALHAGADRTVLIVTPDDVCIRDAERAASLIASMDLPSPWLIVNRLNNDLIWSHSMYSAVTVSNTLDLPLLGEIPEDPAFALAQHSHRLVVSYDCEARNAFLRIAARLAGSSVALPAYGRKRTPLLRRHFPAPVREVDAEK